VSFCRRTENKEELRARDCRFAWKAAVRRELARAMSEGKVETVEKAITESMSGTTSPPSTVSACFAGLPRRASRAYERLKTCSTTLLARA